MPASPKPPFTLADLAAGLGRTVEGDGNTLITGVGSLDRAEPTDIAFVRSKQYQELARKTRAGALILPDELDCHERPVIRSPNPALDFARVARRIVGGTSPEPGPTGTLRVSSTAKVDPTSVLAAGVVVGPGSSVGSRSTLHPGVVMYADVTVGEDCVIHSGCVLREGTRIADRVVLQPGVVIGGEGFGYVADEEGVPRHMPHMGRVRIESDVEIGALTSVDRGTFGETRIRRGAKIDNQVQIAHNCDVGENAIIAAHCGLSGSTRIEAGAVLMGGVGSAGHLTVGAGAFVGAGTGLHRDVPAGTRVYGFPQQTERAWHRTVAALTRLPGWLKRLRAVEQAVERLGDAESRDESEENG